MTNNDAYEFGRWCKEQNSIRKAEKIKKAFDKMVNNELIFNEDYDYRRLIKGALERRFESGYRGVR